MTNYDYWSNPFIHRGEIDAWRSAWASSLATAFADAGGVFAAGVYDFVLTGSQYAGVAHEWSDIDVLVVLDRPDHEAFWHPDGIASRILTDCWFRQCQRTYDFGRALNVIHKGVAQVSDRHPRHPTRKIGKSLVTGTEYDVGADLIYSTYLWPPAVPI